ncbi:hypothetical protein B0J17DRAFT_245571 [Rhizoctonia solani]|nr:hypothetical protein B0J17DRAFT_245571 [Rhizoctonia solani]
MCSREPPDDCSSCSLDPPTSSLFPSNLTPAHHISYPDPSSRLGPHDAGGLVRVSYTRSQRQYFCETGWGPCQSSQVKSKNTTGYNKRGRL